MSLARRAEFALLSRLQDVTGMRLEWVRRRIRGDKFAFSSYPVI